MGLSTFDDSLAKEMPHHKHLVDHGWEHKQSTPHDAQAPVKWEDDPNQKGHKGSIAYVSHHYEHPKHGHIGVTSNNNWHGIQADTSKKSGFRSTGKGKDVESLVKHLSKKSMKEEYTFTYEVANETFTFSHKDIGALLEHVSQHPGAVILSATLPNGKSINENRIETLNTLVIVATDHYAQKAAPAKKPTLVENLKTVLSNPKKIKKLIAELELPDLEVGDILKVGKFKNRPAEIKGFSTDEHGQPVADTTKGDQKIFKPRIAKLEPGAADPMDDDKGEEPLIKEAKETWSHPHEAEAKKRGYELKKTFNKGEGRTYSKSGASLDVYKDGRWRHVNNPGTTSPFISQSGKYKDPTWD